LLQQFLLSNIKLQYDFHNCTLHLDSTESLIYPTDAQLDCSKNVKIYRNMKENLLSKF